jgi:hypothetical protein
MDVFNAAFIANLNIKKDFPVVIAIAVAEWLRRSSYPDESFGGKGLGVLCGV